MNRCLVAYIVLALFISLQYEVSARPPLEIINGTTAEEGEFPYMVQLLTAGTFFCGGSILAPDWILTAAHCVENGFIDSIVYGTNKIYGSNDTSIAVKNYFQHPNFTHITIDQVPIYDVGILQLAEPIPFSENAQPIHIADENDDIPFHVAGVVSGWGMEGIWGPSPKYLQKINLPLLTDDECINKVKDYLEDVNSFIPAHHLCTDDNNNGVCYGDSGSPYVINGTQYGITSWSAYPGIAPGAYSRITNPEYRRWIRNITNI